MKIAVVGAGPAGSFCAYRLAQAGAEVTQFDRYAEAWEKPCGGGVPPKVRERFAEIAAYDGPRRVVNVGNFTSPKGVAVRLEGGRALWIVSRRDFDGYIRRLARDAGARFANERIRRVERDGNGFILHGEGEHRFDFVVGADGVLSVVRRDLLAPMDKRLVCMTVGYFLEADLAEAATWFLPKPGYVWSFPRTDHTCLGGGTSDPDLDMWPLIEEIRRNHYPTNKILKKWAAPIPAISVPAYFDQPISGDGFALVGDAAGHVDALSGEGIFYAIWGGHLLARALIEGKPTQYEDAWRGEYGRELQKTSDMAGAFYKPKMIERFLWVASRSEAMREFFGTIMTDEPSYLTLRKMFVRRLPRIAFQLLRSLW